MRACDSDETSGWGTACISYLLEPIAEGGSMDRCSVAAAVGAKCTEEAGDVQPIEHRGKSFNPLRTGRWLRSWRKRTLNYFKALKQTRNLSASKILV
jgi:hypothetical protein